MRDSTLKTLTEPRPFLEDDHGCLYDPRVRAALARYRRGDQLAPFEALGALRLAAKRIHMAMDRWADRNGLSEGRLYVLMRLFHQPEHRMALGELAETLDVTPRTITGLIDHLEEDGLVERIPDPSDRRSIQAKLTDGGRQRIEGIWRHGFEQQTAVSEGLSTAELVQLRHICLRLIQNLNRIEGGSNER